MKAAILLAALEQSSLRGLSSSRGRNGRKFQASFSASKDRWALFYRTKFIIHGGFYDDEEWYKSFSVSRSSHRDRSEFKSSSSTVPF